MQTINMAKDKKGTTPVVNASKQSSNGVDGQIIVELVMVDGKLTADVEPGVRQ